jgi:hypothetical protein
MEHFIIHLVRMEKGTVQQKEDRPRLLATLAKDRYMTTDTIKILMQFFEDRWMVALHHPVMLHTMLDVYEVLLHHHRDLILPYHETVDAKLVTCIVCEGMTREVRERALHVLTRYVLYHAPAGRRTELRDLFPASSKEREVMETMLSSSTT